jgi:acylphosphatase
MEQSMPGRTEEDHGPVRMEVIFRGRVQGVFFRATAERIARGRPVDGWVRNEADGSVRLVAEGRRAELETFLAAVQEAKRRGIEEADVRWGPADGGLVGFAIRR